MKARLKRKLKYIYYKALCRFFGREDLKKSSSLKSKLVRFIPGRSAVLLQVKGNIAGVGYSRWLRRHARASGVSCSVQKKGSNRAEILLVGPIKEIMGVAQAARMGPGEVKIKNIRKRWFDKKDRRSGEGKSFVITFVGDTSLGDNDLRRMKNQDIRKRLESNPLSFFEGVTPLIDKTDHLIINFETVLADNPAPVFEKNYLKWDDPERTIDTLKKIGVTAASLANNHIMDYGPDLMLETERKLTAAGINCFGVGENLREASEPLELTLKGKYSRKNVFIITGMRASKRYREKYRFFAGPDNAGVNSLDKDHIIETIKRVRRNDSQALIIVCPHWQGIDYKWAHLRLARLCRSFVDHGADFVIGHGPHMIQQVEQYSRGFIVYSLGNFVFNTRGEYKKRGAPPYSFVARMELRERKKNWVVGCKLYPILTDNRRQKFCVRPVTKSEAVDAYNQLALNTVELNKFLGFFKLERDQHGWHIAPLPIMDEISKTKIIGETDICKYILGDKSLKEISFGNIGVLEKQIDELELFHNEIDAKLKKYYRRLFRSKLLQDRTGNESMYDRLSKTVKRDYISFTILRKFALRKTNIRRAISFRDIVVERSEVRRLGDYDIAKRLNKKDIAYKFADKIGLRRPVTGSKIYKFNEIEPQEGPIVIKPLNATGSMGVYLIFNKNKIYSAREGVFLRDWSELVNDVKQKIDEDLKGENKYFKRDQWLLEELILSSESDNIPGSDLKFFSFYGEVVMVMETNRITNHKKYCYWDKDMNLIKTGRHDKESQSYKGIGFSKEDLGIVVQASLHIPTPFVRIDMLKGHDGLVFGEVQFITGNFQEYNDEYDRKMGEAYRIAEQNIIKDLLKGKEFEAFNSLFIK